MMKGLSLVAIAVSCLAINGYSQSLVNNSGGPITIGDHVNQQQATIASGASIDLVAHFGDDPKHRYLMITSAQGQSACGNMQQYGLAKLPNHANYEVLSNLNCQEYNGALPAEEEVVDEPPVDEPIDDPVVDDPGNQVLVPPTYDTFPLRAKGNGTWLYDAQFLDGPTGKAYTKAGLWLDNINQYNRQASAGNKITQLFTYGGNLEMYCLGSGDSMPDQACGNRSLLVLYYPPSFYNDNLTIETMGESGFHSTQVYRHGTDAVKDQTGVNMQIIAVVDGRVDNPSSNDYLNAFNHMDKATAERFADNVARVYCADKAVSGVQFDIEPFNVDHNHRGQYYFYKQIAKNFAGKHEKLAFRCVDNAHPEGRSFSIFTFPHKVNQDVADIVNEYNNGYLVYSLYDLEDHIAPTNIGGLSLKINTPERYYQLVLAELEQAKQKAQQYQVYYQVAIPAAASVHEFEKVNGVSTGYNQLDYVKSAVKAIHDSGVANTKYYLGVALWGWSRYMTYPPHSPNTFEPNYPQTNVLDYLAKNLSSS